MSGAEGGLEGVVVGRGAVVPEHHVPARGLHVLGLAAQEEPVARPGDVIVGDQVRVARLAQQDAGGVATAPVGRRFAPHVVVGLVAHERRSGWRPRGGCPSPSSPRHRCPRCSWRVAPMSPMPFWAWRAETPVTVAPLVSLRRMPPPYQFGGVGMEDVEPVALVVLLGGGPQRLVPGPGDVHPRDPVPAAPLDPDSLPVAADRPAVDLDVVEPAADHAGADEARRAGCPRSPA